MNAREFLTKWGFEVDNSKLNKVEQQLDSIKHRLEFLAAAQIVKGLFELGERFAKFAEELHVAATSAGITAEEFQKLAFSAKQSAVEQGEMESSMKILSRRLYEARLGGAEAQKSFQLMGFSGEQVRGFKTSQDALYAIADRFKNMKDPIEKAALAQQMMGRGSLHMVGFLSQGSKAIKEQGDEAQKLGLVLSGTQVEALVELEHALQKLWGLLQAIGATLAAQIAPSMKDAINSFIEFFRVNREIIQTNIKTWLHEFLYGLGYLWGALEIVFEVLMKVAKSLHLEGHIFPLIMHFATLVLGLFAIRRAVSSVMSVFNLLKTTMSIIGFVAKASFGPWLGVLAAVAFAVHEIWNAFHGEKTWTQEFLEWLGIWEAISDAVQAVFGFIFKMKDSIGNILKNNGGVISTISKVAVGAYTGNMPSNDASNHSSTVQAPVTINVPPGTDPKDVGKHVQNGIREHLDRTMREAHRSGTSAVAY